MGDLYVRLIMAGKRDLQSIKDPKLREEVEKKLLIKKASK